MAAKYQLMTELYESTGIAVTKNAQAWEEFLTSACRNYKCRFDEQLLIYAQRPDASAVAEISTWNRLFKRWVNKDSRGIAVFDRKGSRNALRYYFDISDTHEGYYGSRPVFIWKVNGKYEQLVMDRLADRFEVEKAKTLASILKETAQNAVDDDLPDYVAQLAHCTEGSDLEKMGAYDIAVIYRRLAANSVAFMLFCRCGLDTDGYFKGEDFEDILNFNTTATVNAIGTAVSDISEVVLREISQTIRDAQIGERKQGRTFAKETANQYDKSRTEKERREKNERDHIHQAGGLSDPRPDLRTRAGASSWQVRIDAPGLSGEVQKGDLFKPSDIREPEPSSARVGEDSPEAFGTNDEAARSRTGSNRGAEGKGSDPMGADDERDTESGRGSDIKGADLQLGLQNSTASGEEVTVNLPTVEEQVERMMEAEEENASALSISQEDIDAFLARGGSFDNSKYRIYRQFQKMEDKKSNIEFLKKEYGTGGVSYTYPDGTRGMVNYNARGISIEKQGSYAEPDKVLKWTQVEKRLRELIGDDRYLNPKEKDHYIQYLESISAPEYEIDTQEKIKRRRFINAHRELPPADKRDTLSLRLSDFIRDMDGYEKNLLSEVGRTDLSDVTAGQMEQYLSEPAMVQKLIDFLALVQGRTSDVFIRSNAWRFREELRELHPLWYLYHEGDIVYIGADQYEITALSEDKVSLRNIKFPIFAQEYSREDLEEKLEENPSNEHLKVIVTESQAEKLPAEEKAEGIRFSIGFSEHPAFYDREMKDRFTDLNFALGNKLLGILDEKQHEERADESKHAGWYKKTDFEISAVIEGEDFHYEGRFDIGDGEGDLIAHIKNFYEYSLSPDCPFIPEWKRKGEDYYREQMETFHWGQDVFVPFLEQHAELTAEDERLFAEIMATESDWFHRGKESFKEELLEKAKHWIDTFCKKEYGSDAEADYTEPSNVKLAFTTTEDELHEIQASVNLTEYRMETYIDDTLVGYTQYEDLDNLIRNALSVLNFSDLVSVTEEQLEPFYQEGSDRGAGEDEGERRNYRITDDTLGTGTAKEKFKSNMKAIHLLHELQTESRLATPKEQETLSKYVGWGGLSMAFDERNAAWEKEYKELRYVLSEKEYRAAMESTLTAFYTPPVVIRAMYEILDRLGFSQGNILEPSCGTGNFFGLLPESMEGSKLYGIEIDSLSGGIAKQLYQKTSIAVEGFEDTKLPDGYFDVVLGNVPFGDFKVNDSRYNAQKFLVHDYFFAKALDKVRAGGIVLFLTSKGTMDKSSSAVRKYLAQRAELLGAIRLPDNTFKANAGTEVTSDILILQKRERIIEAEPDWIYLDTDENGITMNRYFIEHPEMILGRMKLESTRFGMDTVCKADQDVSLSESLKKAVQKINGELLEPDAEVDRISDSDESELSIAADPEIRNFSFTLVDGKVYFRENNRMNPAKVSMTAGNRIKGLVELRDCVRRLIKFQTDDCPEEMIRSEQMKLNDLYDAFTARYGLINSRGNYLAFAADESYFLLCSLEVLDDEGKFKRKADMFSKRTIKPHREVTSVGTASEALAVSIGEKAQVDLEYMAQLTGKTRQEIIEDLRGVIFKVPNSEPEKYVTADEYLSGNVRAKLIAAKTAAKENPEYEVHVKALERVIPKDLPASEISVRLGTVWIPEEDIQQFVMELLTPSVHAAGRIRVRYTPVNGDWFIENKGADFGNIKADNTYGTKRASAYRIIEDALNLRDTRIFDYVYDENGNKKAVFNAKETMAAQAKQEVVKQAFQDWIWKDTERRSRLVRYYNDTFNSVRPREYDGSHIAFGGISPEIRLRTHQVNAIAHILYGGNTLLAHKVGAGKTFEMVAAAQESKRLGLCQKSMFVVPNHLVGQWASEYLRLYPSANILVSRKQDFETANRKKFCGRIATGSYDAVIIGHSQFERIPISEGRQREQLIRQLDDIEHGIDDVKVSHGEQFTVKQLMKTRKAIRAKLDKLNDTKRKDKVINFEELGIDRLFIDESHFYKNRVKRCRIRQD